MDPRTGWVAAMSLAQLVSWGSLYYTFSLLMPALEADLGLNRVEVSGAFSAALLAGGVAGVQVGRWIDAGHGRAVMSGGSLLAGAMLLVLARIEGVVGLYAVWIAIGAATAAILYEPAFAILIRRWPDDYRRSLIAMTFLGGLASTVFIPLSAWLIDAFGWRRACEVLAGLHLLLCLPIHLTMLAGEPPGRARTTAGAAGDAPTLRALATSPAFLLITAFLVGFMAFTSALSAHMVPLMRERGVPAAWAVAIPASIGAMQVLGRVVLFVFEGRIDPRRFDRLVPLLLPAAIALLLAGGGSVVAALAFAACYGIGNGLITIVKATSIAQYVSRERVAALSGLQQPAAALARAAGPILLASLWSATGDYGLGLWVLLGAGLVSAALLRLAQARALPQP
ncbi:MAG: MFS transporter [Burkholderiales bacterium]|nr:MAG: MFS transporter [Burkholderiales bacterium]